MYHLNATTLREKFIDSHLVGKDYRQAPSFYEDIAHEFGFRSRDDVAFIVVPHLLHDLPYLLECMSRLGSIVSIISKNAQYVPEVKKTLKELYAPFISDLSKKDFIDDQSSTKLTNYFNHLISQYPNKRFVIIDHGGYFAYRPEILAQFNQSIAAIIEHTLNGHQRYEEALQSLHITFPIFSIAQSRLKAHEDRAVAESIVYAIRVKVFAENGIKQDFNRMTFGIIGYGHMGSAIAKLLSKLVGPNGIYICDNAPQQQKLARQHFEHVSANNQAILTQCDVIITAASAKVLSLTDFNQMKAGACVVCATSRDDQFQPDVMPGLTAKQSIKSAETPSVVTYQRADKKEIHLAYDGKTINFPIGASADPIFHAVLASLCISGHDALQVNRAPTTGIREITDVEQVRIERIYEKHFGPIIRATSSFGLGHSSVYFVGRKKELDLLGQALKNSHNHLATITQKISGLGGIGKTTLASHYAMTALKEGTYDYVIFLDATSTKTLYEDFLLLAHQLFIDEPRKKSVKILIQEVYESLKRYANVLIIFDNPQQYRILNQANVRGEEVIFLPPPMQAGQVVHSIITTRSKNFQSEQTISLEPLSIEEACEYIQHYLPNYSLADCKKLASTFSNFPLALCQMVAYLVQHPHETATSYLVMYARRQRYFLSKDVLPEDRYQASIYITWAITLHALSPQSIAWLNLLSFFSSGPIPMASLKTHPETEDIERALQSLEDYAFIAWNKKNHLLRLHALVQTVVRLKQVEEENFEQLRTAFDLALQYTASLTVKPFGAASFASHALAITTFHDRHLPQESAPEKVRLLRMIADSQLYDAFVNNEATETYRWLLKIAEREQVTVSQLDVAIRIAVANPLQFGQIIHDLLASSRLQIDDVVSTLRRFGLNTNLHVLKKKLMPVIFQEIAAMPQYAAMQPEWVKLLLSMMPPNDFFNLLLSDVVKQQWLPKAEEIIYHMGSEEVAIAYLMFNNQLNKAARMAAQFLRSTANEISDRRVQALIIYVAVNLFQGKSEFVKYTRLMKQACDLLQNPAFIHQFYFDQAHFILAVLYGLQNNHALSNEVLSDLIEKMSYRHGEEGVRNRIETCLDITTLVKKNIAHPTNEIDDQQVLLKILAHTYRLAARVMVKLSDRDAATRYFRSALDYQPGCKMTHYEHHLFVVRHQQERQQALVPEPQTGTCASDVGEWQKECAALVPPTNESPLSNTSLLCHSIFGQAAHSVRHAHIQQICPPKPAELPATIASTFVGRFCSWLTWPLQYSGVDKIIDSHLSIS